MRDRRNLVFGKVQDVVVSTREPVPITVNKRERVHRIFDEVSAHTEIGPSRPIRILRSVATKVASNLPAIHHFAQFRFFGENCLPCGGDAFVNRFASIGIERRRRELCAGLDADPGEPRHDGCVRRASGIVDQ